MYPAEQIEQLMKLVPDAKESECLEMIWLGKENVETKLAKRIARRNQFVNNIRAMVIENELETNTEIDETELYNKYELGLFDKEDDFYSEIIQPVIDKKEENQRVEQLSQYLKQQGLEYRQDSEVCRRWVKNPAFKTMEQVSWIMRDVKYLHTKTDYHERISEEISKRKRNSYNYEPFNRARKRCKLEALSEVDDPYAKQLAQRLKHNDEWYSFENETYSSSEYEDESDSDDDE
jgi:hypothetical protein